MINGDDTNNLQSEEDFELIFSPRPTENPVYIDDLEDAISYSDENTPVLNTDKHGYVVIERWHVGRWLGTNMYKVTNIDLATGNVHLYDEDNMQSAMANFITGPRHGWRFKLPIKGLSLHKREPPPVPTEGTQKTEQRSDDGSNEPKRRGRPKGSKNRSRAELSAEKTAKAAIRKAKKEARLAKKLAKKERG